MNDPDNFLSRWSRRKQEAGAREEKEKAAGETPPQSVTENEPGQVASATPDPTPVPKVDAETLPPIESISAETDVTAFMRTGVPEALKRAALRRAWSSDPAVRDFVGLNENYWDAGGPDGIAGFGALDPNLDIKRMVSELVGEVPREGASSDSSTDRVVDSSTTPSTNQTEVPKQPQQHLAPAEKLLQRNENAALQTPSPQTADPTEQADPTRPTAEKKFARRHGGAIPR